MDPFKTKGEIGLSSGIILTMIHPDTPDDPAKIQQLKEASQQILKVAI